MTRCDLQTHRECSCVASGVSCRVQSPIVAELVECSGITAEQAQAIVGHLVRGLVPNVTLQY